MDGEPVIITPRVFDTLLVLVQNSDRLLSKQELMRLIWPDTSVDEANLTQNISVLRRILGDKKEGAKYIQTVSGRGYQFVAPVRELADEQVPPPAKFEVVAATAADGPERALSRPAWSLAAGLLAIAVLVSVALYLWLDHSARTALSGVTPTPLTSLAGMESQPALSPSGDRVAFVWAPDLRTNPHIYIKPIGSETLTRLTSGTAAEESPAWSPDGRSIAFLRLDGPDSGAFVLQINDGKTRKIVPVLPARNWLGNGHLDWSPDGRYLALDDQETAAGPLSIYIVAVADGRRTRLTFPPSTLVGDVDPHFSPDGHSLAFIRMRSRMVNDIYVASLTAKSPQTVRVTSFNQGIAGLDWLANGKDLLFSSNTSGTFNLWTVPIRTTLGFAGKPRMLLGGENAAGISVAQSAKRFAYAQTFSESNIWQMEIRAPNGGIPGKLIDSTRDDLHPQYSEDGRKIAFRSDRSGFSELWIADRDGANLRQVTSCHIAPGSLSWSPDGKFVAFDSRVLGSADIYVVDLVSGIPRRITNSGSEDVVPHWSSDGKWVYFSSNRTGTWQIWKVRSAGGATVQVTQHGGFSGVESANGKFLYYSKDRTLPTIWRIPASGGVESRVFEGPEPMYWDRWALFSDSIYFLDGGTPAGPSAPTLEKFDFSSHKIERILQFPRPLAPQGGGNFAISPDRKQLLFVQIDGTESDLKLVERFR
jgi:Tol biopolymer transport system component/DNA-binding winged helix-turn-helix (wHTH) protein